MATYNNPIANAISNRQTQQLQQKQFEAELELKKLQLGEQISQFNRNYALDKQKTDADVAATSTATLAQEQKNDKAFFNNAYDFAYNNGVIDIEKNSLPSLTRLSQDPELADSVISLLNMPGVNKIWDNDGTGKRVKGIVDLGDGTFAIELYDPSKPKERVFASENGTADPNDPILRMSEQDYNSFGKRVISSLNTAKNAPGSRVLNDMKDLFDRSLLTGQATQTAQPSLGQTPPPTSSSPAAETTPENPMLEDAGTDAETTPIAPQNVQSVQPQTAPQFKESVQPELAPADTIMGQTQRNLRANQIAKLEKNIEAITKREERLDNQIAKVQKIFDDHTKEAEGYKADGMPTMAENYFQRAEAAKKQLDGLLARKGKDSGELNALKTELAGLKGPDTQTTQKPITPTEKKAIDNAVAKGKPTENMVKDPAKLEQVQESAKQLTEKDPEKAQQQIKKGVDAIKPNKKLTPQDLYTLVMMQQAGYIDQESFNRFTAFGTLSKDEVNLIETKIKVDAEIKKEQIKAANDGDNKLTTDEAQQIIGDWSEFDYNQKIETGLQLHNSGFMDPIRRGLFHNAISEQLSELTRATFWDPYDLLVQGNADQKQFSNKLTGYALLEDGRITALNELGEETGDRDVYLKDIEDKDLQAYLRQYLPTLKTAQNDIIQAQVNVLETRILEAEGNVALKAELELELIDLLERQLALESQGGN